MEDVGAFCLIAITSCLVVVVVVSCFLGTSLLEVYGCDNLLPPTKVSLSALILPPQFLTLCLNLWHLVHLYVE